MDRNTQVYESRNRLHLDKALCSFDKWYKSIHTRHEYIMQQRPQQLKTKFNQLKTTLWNRDCFTWHAWLVVYFIDHSKNRLLQKLQSCASFAFPQKRHFICSGYMDSTGFSDQYTPGKYNGGNGWVIYDDRPWQSELLHKDYDFTLVLSYSSVMINL